MKTLPDHLATGLDIVFVGLNPGLYSAQVGYYFATPSNRFWTAINCSGLLEEKLEATSDYKALGQGFGLTDVAKRPSSGASDLRADDFRRWVPVLTEKLERFQPLIVCFQGVTAYRNYLKFGDGVAERLELGLQPHSIGRSKVFVVPNPSAANAAYRLETLLSWYRQLRDLRDQIRK